MPSPLLGSTQFLEPIVFVLIIILPLAILLHLELSVFIRVPSKRARVCSLLVCESLAWEGENGINSYDGLSKSSYF